MRTGSVWQSHLSASQDRLVHTSPLFFAALTVERWTVLSVASSGDHGGNRDCIYEPQFKWQAQAYAYALSKHAVGIWSLLPEPQYRAAAHFAIGGYFMVKPDLRSSRSADWFLKEHYFAFCCYTLGDEAKNKTLEWLRICSEGSVPRLLENTTYNVSNIKGSFSRQSPCSTHPVHSTSTLISHRYASTHRCHHKMCLKKSPQDS